MLKNSILHIALLVNFGAGQSSGKSKNILPREKIGPRGIPCNVARAEEKLEAY